MKIIKKICDKNNDYYNNDAITIAFLGDSVTHGCFECYEKSPGVMDTYFDIKNAYPAKVKEYLNMLYPSAQINIIDSGLSGDSMFNGERRLERDVLKYSPDLVVVSFGLNDCCLGKDGLNRYLTALESIIKRLKEKDIEIIFMTENMMCDHISPAIIKDSLLKGFAECFSKIENSGDRHLYFEKAKELSIKYNVPVCDMSSLWETLSNNGVDTTELLANKLNHPNKDIHKYMAIKLIETMFLN